VEPDDPVIQSMLVEAQQKASALVDRLREQQAEIDANPPDLPPEQLAAGRAAMRKAIESAERTLAALRAAALSSQSRNN
jgi:hypothetical protein